MKKIIVLFTILLNSCSPNENLNPINITESDWKLLSISYDDQVLMPTSGDHFRNDAYILRFRSDTLFELSTSVNYATGTYLISNKNQLSVIDYKEITEVGAPNNEEMTFNNYLIDFLNSATELNIVNSNLIIKGDSFELTFEEI